MQYQNTIGASLFYPKHSRSDGGRSQDRPFSDSAAYTSEREGRGQPSPVSPQSGAYPHHPHDLPPNPKLTGFVQVINTIQDINLYVNLNLTANLQNITRSIVNHIRECDPKYVVSSCKCGRRIVPSTCMNARCVKCAPFVGLRRAKRAYDRLLFNTGSKYHNKFYDTICYTVFTIPELLRDKYQSTESLKLLRSQLWQILKNKYGAMFGVQAIHPIGEKDDMKFHPHLNFLWRIRDGVRPYINTSDLISDYQTLLDCSCRPDVYHEYSDIPGKVWHWVKYVLRVFPQFTEWLGNIQWYGSFPKIDFKREILCAVCQQKYVTIGFMSATLIRDYYTSGLWYARPPPWEDDDKIQRFKPKYLETATAEEQGFHAESQGV